MNDFQVLESATPFGYRLNTGNDTYEMKLCGHCGNWHQGTCPRIKAIEYYENGSVKRVEYHGVPA